MCVGEWVVGWGGVLGGEVGGGGGRVVGWGVVGWRGEGVSSGLMKVYGGVLGSLQASARLAPTYVQNDYIKQRKAFPFVIIPEKYINTVIRSHQLDNKLLMYYFNKQ